MTARRRIRRLCLGLGALLLATSVLTCASGIGVDEAPTTPGPGQSSWSSGFIWVNVSMAVAGLILGAAGVALLVGAAAWRERETAGEPWEEGR